MKNRTVGPYATLAIVFGLGLAVGYFANHKASENQMLIEATADELQDGLDVYRMCMQSAGKTGCRMSVDNFRQYHAIKRELARRGVAAQ